MIHAWQKYGLAKAQEEFEARWQPATSSGPAPRFEKVVRGKLEFVKMIVGPDSEVYRNLQTRYVKVDPAYSAVIEQEHNMKAHKDLFICHVSDDKEEIVRPLVKAITGAGLSVWYDEYEILIGDSIVEKINHGLIHSSFGLVMVSKAFLASKKFWTGRELDGLVSREDVMKKKLILPVWHKVTKEEVADKFPILAGLRAAVTDNMSLNEIVKDLIRKVKPPAK